MPQANTIKTIRVSRKYITQQIVQSSPLFLITNLPSSICQLSYQLLWQMQQVSIRIVSFGTKGWDCSRTQTSHPEIFLMEKKAEQQVEKCGITYITQKNPGDCNSLLTHHKNI